MCDYRSNRKALACVAGITLVLASLTGCTGTPPAPAATTSAPTPNTAPGGVHQVTASATVVPAEVTDLAFLISAPVSQVTVSAGQSVHQGESLITLDVPGLSYGVKAAQDALTSAQADEHIQSLGRRKWDGTKYVWLSGPPEQRQLAHAKTLQAQAALEVAQAELDQATLRAPFDGAVVAIHVSAGEIVRPGQVVLTMADLKHLQIQTTDLSEREIAGIQPGQTASIAMKAFADDLRGTVSRIDPMAGRSADGDIVYTVTIELKQQPADLMWGMTGDVTIDTSG